MEKILTFIIKENKLLLLKGSPRDPQFHKSFWYVVTGAREHFDKSLEDTVKREELEETGLTVNSIIDLNWVFEYESLGINCKEHAFVSYVSDGNVLLNEESIDYKWCYLDEFLKLIKWYENKDKLKKIISKYLK